MSGLRAALSLAPRWCVPGVAIVVAVAGMGAVAGPSFARGRHDQQPRVSVSSPVSTHRAPAVEKRAAKSKKSASRSRRVVRVKPAVARPSVVCSAGHAVVRWQSPTVGTGIRYAAVGDEAPGGVVHVLAAAKKGYVLARASGWVREAGGRESTTLHFPSAPAGCASNEAAGSSAVSITRTRG